MKTLLALFVSLFVASAATATETVRMVVPFSAGGPGDKLGRLIQKQLKETKNITVIVENRPGANAEIGTAAVAKTRTNEVVLLIGINSMAEYANNKDYDVTRDLTPVAYLGTQPWVLAAHPTLGVKNLADLQKLGKQISLGTSTKGTPNYSNAEELASRLKLDAAIVGHRGMADYLPQLIGNHVQVAFFSPSIIEQHVASGAVVPLAVINDTRLPGWNNVPTFEEQGFKNFGAEFWYILMVNSTADKKVVAEIRDAMVNLLSKKPTADEYRKIDVYPNPQLTLQGSDLIARQIQKYNKK